MASKSATAEEIVMALAEQPAPVASDNGFTSEVGTYCLHCPAKHPTQRPQDHDAMCPWRMAQEWVAQNPAGSSSAAVTEAKAESDTLWR